MFEEGSELSLLHSDSRAWAKIASIFERFHRGEESPKYTGLGILPFCASSSTCRILHCRIVATCFLVRVVRVTPDGEERLERGIHARDHWQWRPEIPQRPVNAISVLSAFRDQAELENGAGARLQSLDAAAVFQPQCFAPAPLR